MAQMPQHWTELCKTLGEEIFRLGAVHSTLGATRDLPGLRALHSNPQVDPCGLDQIDLALTPPGKEQIDLLAQEAREKTVKAQQLADENTERLAALSRERESLDLPSLSQGLARAREEAKNQISIVKERLRECDDEDCERRKSRNQVFLDKGYSQGDIDSWNSESSKKVFLRIRCERFSDLQTSTTEGVKTLMEDGNLLGNGQNGLAKVCDNQVQVLSQSRVAQELRGLAMDAENIKIQARQVVKALEDLRETGDQSLERIRTARADAADKKEDKKVELLAIMQRLLQVEHEFKDACTELQICQVAEESLTGTLGSLDGKLEDARGAEVTALEACEVCRAAAVQGEAQVQREVQEAARTCVTEAREAMTQAALTHQMAITLLQMQITGSSADLLSAQKQLASVKEQLGILREAKKNEEGGQVDALQDEISTLAGNAKTLSETIADLEARLEQQKALLSAACAKLDTMFQLDGFGSSIDQEEVRREGEAWAKECYRRFGPMPLNLESSAQGLAHLFRPPPRTGASPAMTAGSSGSCADALNTWTNPDALQEIVKSVTKEAMKQAQVAMMEQQKQRDSLFLQHMEQLQEQTRLATEQNQKLLERLRRLEDDRMETSSTVSFEFVHAPSEGPATGASPSLPPC